MLSTFLRSAAQATDSTLIGMQGEQRAHNQAGPGDSGRPPQQKKEQHSVGGVQQKICVVMAGGIEVKDLVVQGVR